MNVGALRVAVPITAPGAPVWMYSEERSPVTYSAKSCVFSPASAVPAVAVPIPAGRTLRRERGRFGARAQPVHKWIFMAGDASGEGDKDDEKPSSGNGGGKDPKEKLAKAWKWYKNELDTKPILTKSWTSAVVFTCSDITSQAITNRSFENLDLLRTSKMALFGLVYNGPVLHYWFGILQNLIKGSSTPAVIGKALIDQFFASPIYVTSFFTFQGLLAGESPALIGARLKRDVFPTVRNGWFYWIPAQAINLKFVPPELMLLFQNAASYIWNIYLCALGAKGSAVEELPEGEAAEEGKEAPDAKEAAPPAADAKEAAAPKKP